MAFYRFRVRSLRVISWVDVCLFLAVVFFLYALVGVAQEWAAPFRPKTEIDLGIRSLLVYSFYSLIRVSAAYGLSLIFTLVYGYWAAKSKTAEPILISLLDILQSVPVLGFMPGLVLALVNLFPNSNFGLELAAVVMIFTGEGWNMVFSFYSSVKAVPQDLREMAGMFRLNRFETLRSIELPYAANGLLWNSMLSMAGGWFFLMVIESFSLGDKDFRLPGIGSYMAVAYDQKDFGAVGLGIAVMVLMIVLVDRCIWAPLVVWSSRFRLDTEGHSPLQRSLVLDWLKKSDLLSEYFEFRARAGKAIRKWWDSNKEKFPKIEFTPVMTKRTWQVIRVGVAGIGALLLLYGLFATFRLVSQTSAHVWLVMIRDTALTFIRVMLATLLGSLWTIPAGVFIGTHPRWTQRLQPVVQVVASFPAPMLFPLITLLLIRLGISIEVGSIVLMLFACQWYILFNVISGATQIPTQILEMSEVFRVRGFYYWKAVIIPAIFPSLLNGWITAAGGAWNASIVSEFVQSGGKTLSATGIGATISAAAQRGDYPELALGIFLMVTTVVLLNRLFWGSLYRLAETRFRLEG